MFFSFAFCTFFKIFHVRLGKKSKSVSFSRVYVCVKAKLTLVSFFYFFFMHLSLTLYWDIPKSRSSLKLKTKNLRPGDKKIKKLKVTKLRKFDELIWFHWQSRRPLCKYCYSADPNIVPWIIKNFWNRILPPTCQLNRLGVEQKRDWVELTLIDLGKVYMILHSEYIHFVSDRPPKYAKRTSFLICFGHMSSTFQW